MSSCVVALLATQTSVGAQPQPTVARTTGTPASPASSVGAITNAATVSIMGMTALPNNEDNTVPARQQLFMGVTQPLGRIGSVRLAAIGMGYYRMRDAVGSNSAAEGAIALRALGRLNGVRTWTAIAYGRASALGGLGGLSFAPGAADVALEGVHTDTTVSRRVDLGSVMRAESGLLGYSHGFDMSVGLAVERATRVTTQTMTIQPINDVPVGAPANATPITRTLRALQRREIATGLASLGWRTGHTNWQASVTAPLYTWITRDALSPKPRIAPAVGTLAIAQPITAWLSALGSASTGSSSMGSTALSDDVTMGRRGKLSPVFALGVGVARVPVRNRHGESSLSGILGFESRVIEALDSAAFITDSSETDKSSDTTYRVQVIIDAPSAGSVEVMGDGTSWNVTNMSRGGDGRWRTVLKMSAGAHRIAVRADGGEWVAPPGLPLSNNDFGNPVGLLVLQSPHARN